MANTQRTIRVKFDGDAKGLAASSKVAARSVRGATRSMQKDSSFATQFAGARAKLILAAIAGVLAALPVAGAAAATATALAIGAGLSAIGIVAAAQNKKVRKEFTGLKKHVVGEMAGISKPFRSMLRVVASEARNTFDGLAPSLRRSFRTLAPALSGFTRQLGQAFVELGPALEDMSTAFADVLRQLGPELGPAFEEISAALSDLAGTVSDNADVFAELITFGIRAIAVVFRVVDSLAQFYVVLRRNPLKGILSFWMHYLNNMVQAAAKAFGWIPGLGPKLKKAAADFDEFAAGVRRGLEAVPDEVKIKGDIRDLQSKVHAARARLETVPKEKKPKIRAEIADLKAKIASAKALLASLKDKTVQITTYHNRIYTRPKGFVGPIIGHDRPRAAGGPVHANRSYLVGERGPERLTLGSTGGTITPNRKLGEAGQAPVYVTVLLDGKPVQAMVRAEQRGHDRNVLRRARAGVGANT